MAVVGAAEPVVGMVMVSPAVGTEVQLRRTVAVELEPPLGQTAASAELEQQAVEPDIAVGSPPG